MSTPESRGDKNRASPPLQKVGGTCPLVHPRIYAHAIMSVFVDVAEIKYHSKEMFCGLQKLSLKVAASFRELRHSVQLNRSASNSGLKTHKAQQVG